MRTVKSRRKSLQRGGSRTIQMTIREFKEKLITSGSHPYFGKPYIFILDTIDDNYRDMVDTHILFVKNLTRNKLLTMENIHKFREELEKYSDGDSIQITYDDTIKKADGTEINLKSDPTYQEIKESMREQIKAVFTWKTDNIITDLRKGLPVTRVSDTTPSKSIQQRTQLGGKRKLRRKSKKRKTHHRKTRSH